MTFNIIDLTNEIEELIATPLEVLEEALLVLC